MQASRESKYKEQTPEETVKNIKTILKGLGLVLEENWTDTKVGGFYTLSVNIRGSSEFSTNGKGATKEFARASAYAEFMERLQNDSLSSGDFEDDVLKYRGFIVAPDEKIMSAAELADSGNAFVEMLLKFNGDEEQKKLYGHLSKTDKMNLWKIYNRFFGDNFLTITYYSVLHKRYEYVPYSLSRRLYYTNGMCAGNTPEETLVQGISEIFERFVNIKIFKEKISLPNVPDWYLMRYEKLYKTIKNIENEGRYKVMVKDGSLGGKYPVVALIIIDKRRQSYGMKFGAHPDFEIALERAFSEALQGKNLEAFTGLSYLIFDPAMDPAVVDPEENLLNITKLGLGQYPLETFNQKADYEFSPFPDTAGKSNGDLLKSMLQTIILDGYDVLIRDVSYLGFPSYHVIVPGVSEMYRVDLSVLKNAELEMRLRQAVRNLHNTPDENIKILADYLMARQNALNELSFFMMAGVEYSDKFVGMPFEHLFLLSVCLYKLGNFKEAALMWMKFANYYFGSDQDKYYRCLAHYASAAAQGVTADRIDSILHLFYPEEIASDVCDKMKDPGHIIEKFYPETSCFNCGRCPVAGTCNYALSRRIKKALKDKQAEAALPDIRELGI
jgi:ribosomal protein S12 methylthiotransferase accessory factor